jgi:hypothetical protein
MLRRVALVRTDVSEELSASIIRVTRIGELGTLAVTSNYFVFLRSLRRLLVTANVFSYFTDSCYPDGGGAKFLRNVDSYHSHRVQYPRRRNS